MRHTVLILLAASLSGAATQAAQLFPLDPGSVWEYRAEDRDEQFAVRVGLNQLYSAGRVYSRLMGYVDQPLWVRLNEEGDLSYLDEESGQERILTEFGLSSGPWFEAPFRPCEQEGQAHSDRVPYSGPAGRIAETVAVRYRSFSCADTGVEYEQFAANIGMVSRSMSTLAGPVVFSLTYANVGAVQIAPQGGATLRLALEVREDAITARLRLTADLDAAPTYSFSSTQEFDLLLRDESGEVVWKWSDGKFFSPTIHQKEAVHLAYEAPIPLTLLGRRLPAGDYTVEGWLTPRESERAPRVAARLRLDSPGPARLALRARSRR